MIMGQGGPDGFKDNLIVGLIICSALFFVAFIVYLVINLSYWVSGFSLVALFAYLKISSIRKKNQQK